jgi:Tol biopolymer transport system component
MTHRDAFIGLAMVLVTAAACTAQSHSVASPTASASAQAAASSNPTPRAGGSIIFERKGQLYLVNWDGTGLRQLTTSQYFGPDSALSPDGEKIAYLDFPPGRSPMIFVMNTDGTGATRLTDGGLALGLAPSAENLGLDPPAWSHDGKRIAFIRNLGALYVMNADGSNLIRVSQDPQAQNENPVWLPGDQGIAFNSYESPVLVHKVIYAIDLDGSNQRQLFSDPNWDYLALSPSPDGRRFAVEVLGVNSSSLEPVVGGLQIAVLVPGQSPIQVTQQGGSHPRWSPDGKEIAFDTARDGPHRIYVMNADGSAQKMLPTGAAPDQDDYLVDWAPA